MRLVAAFVAILGVLAACDAPGSGSDAPSAGMPVTDPNTFRAGIDPTRAYAGQWAAAASHCDNEEKVWTIEARRMAIEQMRFCVFDNDTYVSQGTDDGPRIWSTGAKCLSEGKESHDFLFFRVKDNLREMRVTFNDTSSVELVRCPMKS